MIKLQFDGIIKEVDQAGFLILLPLLAKNTSVVARSLNWCFKTGAFERRAETRGYFYSRFEISLLRAIVNNEELRNYLEILATKIYTLQLIDDNISLLVSAQNTGVSSISGSQKSKLNPFKGRARRDYQLCLADARRCIMELEQAQILIEKIALEMRSNPRAPNIKDGESLIFKAPLTLPDLPGMNQAEAKRGRRVRTTQDLVDAGFASLNTRTAIRLFTKVLDTEISGPLAARACLGLGIRYEELDNHARAIEFFTMAMKKSRKPNVAAQYWRGKAYAKLGKLTRARMDLEKALEINSPDSSEKLAIKDSKQAAILLDEINSKMHIK